MRRVKLPAPIPETNPNVDGAMWSTVETFRQSPIARNNDELMMWQHGRLLGYYGELLEAYQNGKTVVEVPLVQDGQSFVQVMTIRQAIENVDAQLQKLVEGLH